MGIIQSNCYKIKSDDFKQIENPIEYNSNIRLSKKKELKILKNHIKKN
jgi:hypothetical protein